MMDPDINVHYERDGTPLNALEIREAWLDGAADEVEMVQDQPRIRRSRRQARPGSRSGTPPAGKTMTRTSTASCSRGFCETG